MGVKLLMHVCCGPCALWPVGFLRDSGLFNVTGLFYNPNIHPIDEFNKRADGARLVFENAGLPLIVSSAYMQREWEQFESSNVDICAASGADAIDGGKGPRCETCYRARIEYTARYARDNGFGIFTTSLLISPYQNHKLIASICMEQASAFGVGFYYEDFRSHFREGQNMARNAGIYRQKYCGCIFSKNNAALKIKKK